MGIFDRTKMLIGNEGVAQLGKAHVAVFGVGGVGGYVVEALARSGVGSFLLVDNDVVAESNINRQIIALHSTIGRAKVEVMKERILDINPQAEVLAIKAFYLPDNAEQILTGKIDYIVDAIDTITAKVDLAVRAQQMAVPIISSMGAGNKLEPHFEVSDIYKTTVCPLAKVMRKLLKEKGIDSLKVVYSKETPLKPSETEEVSKKRATPGSVAFVPSVAGLVIASEVVKDILSRGR